MPKECECKKKKRREQEERQAAEERERRRRICFNGESAYFSKTFTNDDPTKNPVTATRKAYSIIKGFAEDPDAWARYKAQEGGRPQGVILTGPTGTGKTYLCAAAVNAVIDSGKSAAFHRVADLMERKSAIMRRGESLEMFWSELNEVYLLAIDDMNSERKDARTMEFLFELIDKRMTATEKNNCWTIITTNTPRDILEQGDRTGNDRIYSRLQRLLIFTIDGNDARRDDNLSMYQGLIRGGFA